MVMFVGARFSYMGLSMILGNKISAIIAIAVGGIIYGIVLLGIGGVTEEEILAMPKGKKILSKLKKFKLVR